MRVEDRAQKLVEEVLYANSALGDAMLALRQLAFSSKDLLDSLCTELECKTIAELKSQEEISNFVNNVENLLLSSADAAVEISKMIGDQGLWRGKQ